MKKFGQWADEEEEEFSTVDKPEIHFHDFVTLKFETFVKDLKEIQIYETYNPGSVIRLLGYCELSSKWRILWEALPVVVEKKSRIFSPPLRQLDLCTRLAIKNHFCGFHSYTTSTFRTIRIEFNHSLIDYYPGIDAVCLFGIECDVPVKKDSSKDAKGLIQKKLETVHFKPQKAPANSIQEFLKNDLSKFMETISTEDNAEPKSQEPESKLKTPASFSLLPFEILFKVFSFLDLRSLYRCSHVCKTFQSIACDPLLYLEVNLKFYWHLADSILINSITKRCSLVQKVDFSSCGLFGSITSKDFESFIEANGRTITGLRLNSAYFLRTSCLEAISSTCKNLSELQIQNYSNMTPERDFQSLTSLSSLTVLNLSRTGINQADLAQILKNNQNLQKLNLAFPNFDIVMDEICQIISTHNKGIRSANFWKSCHFSNIGLRALSNCVHLEDLDLGWTMKEELNISEPLKLLTQNCRNLKKLVLSAIRSINEMDLDNISNCMSLEQLDLCGVTGVSTDMCLK
jgi:F-box and leucine-rich repeat protein 4